SQSGIYSKKTYPYRAETMISSDFFHEHPEQFYDFYFHEMVYEQAQPNDAHMALAKLERMGKLKAVITQNIDGLHQKAGSHKVLELHGSIHRNHCQRC
ncbi:NAD-dependent protein deacylase, partial [Desulfovibrio desulfuricans]|nr:NAD-dependent protein deacylase [Desulfovibrio desulfuricans]